MREVEEKRVAPNPRSMYMYLSYTVHVLYQSNLRARVRVRAAVDPESAPIRCSKNVELTVVLVD